VNGGKRVSIQGNTIDQSGTSVGSGIDVRPVGTIIEDVIIKKNSITNSKDFGISISDNVATPPKNTVIIDNTFAGNGPSNDNLANGGTDTTKAGNTPPLM